MYLSQHHFRKPKSEPANCASTDELLNSIDLEKDISNNTTAWHSLAAPLLALQASLVYSYHCIWLLIGVQFSTFECIYLGKAAFIAVLIFGRYEMRFLLCFSFALALSSFVGIFDGNLANAAGKKDSRQSKLDDGLVVCEVNSEKKIICNCKQGTQGCTDMIENSCGEGGAHCAGGYCTCEAKDTMFRPNRSHQTKIDGSGTVLENPGTTPKKPVRDQLKVWDHRTAPATGGAANQ